MVLNDLMLFSVCINDHSLVESNFHFIRYLTHAIIYVIKKLFKIIVFSNILLKISVLYKDLWMFFFISYIFLN